MTRTLSRMEKSGWIERLEGSDKREKLIVLSPLAQEAMDSWNNKVEEFESSALEDINEKELEIALEVLRKISQNLS